LSRLVPLGALVGTLAPALVPRQGSCPERRRCPAAAATPPAPSADPYPTWHEPLGLYRSEARSGYAAWEYSLTRPLRILRRRAGTRFGQDRPDSARRESIAQAGQLALDPPTAPGRVLPRQPQHQFPHLARDAR